MMLKHWLQKKICEQRSITSVPNLIVMGLLIGLCLQVILSYIVPMPKVKAKQLPLVYDSSLKMLSFGDEIVLSKILLLWLQSFDVQPGISLSYHDLDYEQLTQWLSFILSLDPMAEYPLLLGSRVYMQVADSVRQRILLNWIKEKFLQHPNKRWRWLAEASVHAKHKLKNLPLALEYAQLLRQHANSFSVPYWAKDLEIILLEDMNEFEAARLLVGALLESGEIKDVYEINFLQDKLMELEQKIVGHKGL